jgi:hypothetical protein
VIVSLATTGYQFLARMMPKTPLRTSMSKRATSMIEKYTPLFMWRLMSRSVGSVMKFVRATS